MSRDGRLLISQHIQGDAIIFVRDVQTMQLLLSVTAADGYSTYEVSPNGRLLAVLSRNTVTIIDLQNGELVRDHSGGKSGAVHSVLPGQQNDRPACWRTLLFFLYSDPVDVVVFGTGLP